MSFDTVMKPEMSRQFDRWLNAQVSHGEYESFTAVHFAIQTGNADLFLLLLSAGADLKLTLKHGVSCLHLAAQANNVRVVHYLLSQKFFDVDSTDHNGCTALHWACMEGSYDVLKYLLAEGASLKA